MPAGDQATHIRGAVRFGKVLKNYALDDGSAVCDVFEMADCGVGSTWTACPIMTFGGGGQTYLQFPAEASTDVQPYGIGATCVLAYTDGLHARPVVLGVLKHNRQTRKTSTARAPDTDDVPEENNPEDVVIEHWGARIVWGRDGRLSIDTQRSARPIDVQVAGALYVRMSQKGYAATERVPLAGPLVAYLDTLVDHITALEGYIGDISDATTAAAAAEAAVPGTGWATMKQSMVGVSKPAPISKKDASLRASAFRVSVKSQEDE